MHGVMLWRSGEAWSRNARDQLVVGTNISSLYTWQDGRCSPDFLRTLPFPRSHLGWADQQVQQQPTHFFFHRLSTGYGCPTIFWLLKNKTDFLCKFDR